MIRTVRSARAAVVVLALCAGTVPAQPETARDWDATVAKAIEHRRYGMRLAVSRAVAAAGDEAVPAVRRYAEAKGKDRLPALLVSQIAECDTMGPATIALLEEWARDRDFYWRSQALGGLARRALVRLRPLFRAALSDPSYLYRVAGARGLLATAPADAGGDEDRARVRALMANDPDPRVRVRTAALLAGTGDPSGAPVLFAALRLRDDFLGDPWGRREASAALDAIGVLLGEKPSYRVTAGDEENAPHLAAIRAALRERVPDWKDARFASSDATFAGGLSVRSCKNGDLFVRWTPNGRVVFGLEPRAGAELPADTWRRLQAGLADLSGGDSGKSGTAGKVICDYMLIQQTTPAATPRSWKIAPGALDSGRAAWLRAFADAVRGAGRTDLADAITSRLGQFAADGGR